MSVPDTHHTEDDFVAGWLLAWQAVAVAGGIPPDPTVAAAPPEVRVRLARGVECLRALAAAWPTMTRADTHPSEPTAGGVLAGRFHLGREIGRGGFGIVYLAHDRALNREVAVKVPRLSLIHI